MSNTESQHYATHYARLKEIATQLNQGNLDIDQLIPLVEEALQSFAICKDRIEKVNSILGEKFPEELQKLGNM